MRKTIHANTTLNFSFLPLRSPVRKINTQIKSDNDYFNNRRDYLNKLYTEEKIKPFPPAPQNRTPLSVFVSEFEGLKDGEEYKDKEAEVCGRVVGRRTMGKILFLTLKEGGSKIQVKITQHSKDFDLYEELIRKSDVITAKGYPQRTNRGELTLVAKEVTLLTPALQNLPDWNHLEDPDIRYRQRYLDLILNRGSVEIFQARSQIIKSLRNYLDAIGFVEVETPILSPSAGGAMAKPFTTFSHSLSTKLDLRIAPELFLKQLVVGGIDRVYEIGKSFRNEGIDTTHNPEFTMCEFYMAYSDYYELMNITEELLRKIVWELKKSYIVEITLPKKKDTKIIVDFSKPFKRVPIMETLKLKLGTDIPSIDNPNALQIYKELCKKHNIKYDEPATLTDVFDELVSHFIESECLQPTFLMDHPIFMSPLAKEHRDKTGVVERFELFIGMMEICNAYTELNDPDAQKQRFLDQTEYQKQLKIEKPVDCLEMEKQYVNALEYGLPPTGGWGMGIDRLVMLLTGKTSIREVILFPALKPKYSDT